MAETVVQILMRRDGNTEQEARDRVSETKELIEEAIERGDYTEPDDIIRDELGLEPDYCFEILGY